MSAMTPAPSQQLAAIRMHSDAARCAAVSVPVRMEIMEATAAHVRELAPRLRAEDALEITSMGERPLSCLWHSWRGSPLRRTVTVDGTVAAMWGVHGALTGGIGIPWLLTAPEIERVPVAMVRHGRREAAAMLDLYPTLENYVMASYGRAVRFLGVLGFTLGETIPIRGVPFRRFTMNAATGESC